MSSVLTGMQKQAEKKDTFDGSYQIPVSKEIQSQFDQLRQSEEFERSLDRKQASEVEQTNIAFMELAQQLRSQKYEKKFVLKWVRKPSAEMQGIFSAMDQFETQIGRTVNAATFADDLMNMQDAYLGIIRACEKYKDTHDPNSREGQLRLELVEQILAQVTQDSQRLEHSAGHYRNCTPADRVTWKTVASSVRTENFYNGVDGVAVKKKGAGTSELYEITKGQQKSFFKEKDKTPPGDIDPNLKSVALKYAELAADPNAGEAVQIKQKVSKLVFTGGDRGLMEGMLDSFSHGTVQPDFFKPGYGLPGELCALYATYVREKQAGDSKHYDILVSVLVEIGKNYNLGITAQNRAHIPVGSDLSVRNAVTSRMADALGLSKVVARSKVSKISVDGHDMEGITMEEAVGKTIPDIMATPEYAGKTMRYSPEALQELSQLQVFDLLCGQVDRHMGNFHVTHKVVGDEVIIEHVHAFDNDMSFGLISGKMLEDEGASGSCVKPIEKNGQRKLPFMDKELAYKIAALSPEQIRFYTCDALTKEEQDAMIDRLETIQMQLANAIVEESRSQADPNVPPEQKKKIFIEGREEWEALRDSLERVSDATKDIVGASTYAASIGMKGIIPAQSAQPAGGAPQQ